MKKVSLILLALMLLPTLAVAENWKDVSLVDTQCAAKVKGNADAHTRSCALQCQKAGYGVVTADGDFLKLDAAGNAQALKLLNNTKQADHLRVNVNGTRSGDTIQVKEINLAKS